MSRRSPLDLMWSLNPIELQGIVVRPSLPHSPPSTLRRFCAPGFPTSSPFLLFSSSSATPKQNFFKCLIFPPFGFLFASALSLVCPSIFHPSPAAAPHPPSYPSSSTSLSSSRLSHPALRLHLPSLSLSPLLLMQTDLFISFKLVAQVICGG